MHRPSAAGKSPGGQTAGGKASAIGTNHTPRGYHPGMFLLMAAASGAELPYPVGPGTAPLSLPRPASGPLPPPTSYRIQQELVPPQSFGLTVLVQEDVRLTARDTPAGRDWTAAPTGSAVAAWTDFGNVPAEQLASARPQGTTWLEGRDGSVSGFQVAGEQGSASPLAAVFGGIGNQLRVPVPDGPVSPGASWTRTQAIDLELPVEDATWRLQLTVDTTSTFLGWSEIDGSPVAVIEGAAHLRGRVLVQGKGMPHLLVIWGRVGAWSWIEPSTGALVYALSQGELRQGSALFGRAETQATTMRSSIARVAADP